MSALLHIAVVSAEPHSPAHGGPQPDPRFTLHFVAGVTTQVLPATPGASADMEVNGVPGREPKLQMRLVQAGAAAPLLEDDLDFPLWEAREPHLVHFVAPGVIDISLQLSWNVLAALRSPEKSPRVPGKHIVTSVEEFIRSYAVPGSATVFDREHSTEGWTFVDGRWVKREYYRLQLTPQQKEVQRLIEQVILLTDQQLWDVHLYFLKIREEMSSQSAFDWCLELLAPYEHICDYCEQYPLWSLLIYRICEMLRSVMQRMHERIVAAEASAEECLTRLELQSPGPNGREVLLEEREWIAKLEETVRALNERPTQETLEACQLDLERQRQHAERFRALAMALEHQVAELSLQARASPRLDTQGELARLQAVVTELQSRCEALETDAQRFGAREEQLVQQIAVLEQRGAPAGTDDLKLELEMERLRTAQLEAQLRLVSEQAGISGDALRQDLLQEREAALRFEAELRLTRAGLTSELERVNGQLLQEQTRTQLLEEQLEAEQQRQKAEVETLRRRWEKDRQRGEEMENMVAILEGLRPELKHFKDEVRREQQRATAAEEQLVLALLQAEEWKSVAQGAQLLPADDPHEGHEKPTDLRAGEDPELRALLEQERRRTAELEDALATLEPLRPELHHLRQEVAELRRRPSQEALAAAETEAERLRRALAAAEAPPAGAGEAESAEASAAERQRMAAVEEQLMLALLQVEEWKSVAHSVRKAAPPKADDARAAAEGVELQALLEQERRRTAELEDALAALEPLRPELHHLRQEVAELRRRPSQEVVDRAMQEALGERVRAAQLEAEVRRLQPVAAAEAPPAGTGEAESAEASAAERQRMVAVEEQLMLALLQVEEWKSKSVAHSVRKADDARTAAEGVELQALLEQERRRTAELEDALATLEPLRPELHHLRQEVAELRRRPSQEVVDRAMQEALGERSRAAQLEVEVRRLGQRPTPEALASAEAEAERLRQSLAAREANPTAPEAVGPAEEELQALREALARERVRADAAADQLEQLCRAQETEDSPQSEVVRLRDLLERREAEWRSQADRRAREADGVAAQLARHRSRAESLEQELWLRLDQHDRLTQQLRAAQDELAQERARLEAVGKPADPPPTAEGPELAEVVRQLTRQLEAERARGEQLECQLSVLELRPTLDEVEAAHRKLRAEVLGLTEELRVRTEQLDTLQAQLRRCVRPPETLPPASAEADAARVAELTQQLAHSQAMVATLQAQLALPPTSAVASETLRTESIHVEAERLRQRVAQREVQLLGGETRPRPDLAAELQAQLNHASVQCARLREQVVALEGRPTLEELQAALMEAHQERAMVHRLQSELQRAREAAEGPSVELARQRALTAHLERELQVLEAKSRELSGEMQMVLRRDQARLEQLEAVLQTERRLAAEQREALRREAGQDRLRVDEVEAALQAARFAGEELRGQLEAERQRGTRLEERLRGLAQRPSTEQWDAAEAEAARLRLQVQQLQQQVTTLGARPSPEEAEALRREAQHARLKVEALERQLADRPHPQTLDGLRADAARERARADVLEQRLRAKGEEWDAARTALRGDVAREQDRLTRWEAELKASAAATETMQRDVIRERTALETEGSRSATQAEGQAGGPPAAGEAEALLVEVQRLQTYIDRLEGQVKDRPLQDLLQAERSRAEDLSHQLQALRMQDAEDRSVRLEWQVALRTVGAQRARIAELEREVQRAATVGVADRQWWREERHRLETSRADARTVHSRLETLEFELRTTRQALERETQQRLQVQTTNVHLESELARFNGVPLYRSIRARSLSPRTSVRYEPLHSTPGDSAQPSRRRSLGSL